MKQTLVIIDTGGSVTVETRGYQGKACLEETREFEEALGGVVSTPTREMQQRPVKEVTRVKR
jgi:hypothetical protein|tara:strand:- start:5660 stop:5845 length:186 start_codon:yes stop_codon:yes gene_type:complete